MSEELSKHQLFIYMGAIDNYIRRRDYRRQRLRERYPILAAVAEVVLRNVIDAVNNHVCPYCGSEMSMRSAVVRHILLSHSEAYYNDIKYAVDVYVKLRKMLTRTNKHRNGLCTQVYKLKTGDGVIVGKQRDIANEILRNPSILQKLGVL